MTLTKTGIVFLITLMFVAGIIVPGVNAFENDSIGETQASGLPTPPIISVDGLSTPYSATYNATELNIPSSIKKYELLTFDIPKMREMLAKNETITVRIRGVPHLMNLRDNTGKAEGLDPEIRSYRGSLEDSENSEVGFTIGKKSISGRITSKGITFFLSTTPKTEKGKVIQYVYTSLDVVSEGQPTYWADDYLAYKNSTLAFTGVPSTTQIQTIPKKASLSPLISLVVLGLIAFIFSDLKVRK
jgi:hypothetical protein